MAAVCVRSSACKRDYSRLVKVQIVIDFVGQKVSGATKTCPSGITCLDIFARGNAMECVSVKPTVLSQKHEAINSHWRAFRKKLNYDLSSLHSKSWDDFTGPDSPVFDFVVTVCDDAAREMCPVWPGQPMSAHWGLPDPAKAEGTDAEKALAFDDTYRMLSQRISIFVNLPLASLSKLSLQEQLDQIGKHGAASAKELA